MPSKSLNINMILSYSTEITLSMAIDQITSIGIWTSLAESKSRSALGGKGVVVLTRVVQGTLKVGMRIRLWSNNQVFNVEELGVLTPKPVRVEELVAGEVGFMIANIKRVQDSKIGDTITDHDRPASEPLPGF